VSRDACVLGVALAGPAAYLGGLDGALGAAAGAGIAVGNFRWLASRAQGAGGDGSPARALWSLAAGSGWPRWWRRSGSRSPVATRTRWRSWPA